MRYAVARCQEWERDEVYRIYVTDALRALLGSKDKRYFDYVEMPEKESKALTAEEVIESIRSKLR